MRVLIVTADDNIAMSLAVSFDANAIRGELAQLGEEALQMLGLYDYDIAIVDEPAQMTGPSFIRKARAGANATPIILLSDKTAAENIEALNAGADDVIEKPFRQDDLLARMRAVVRRSRGHARSRIIIGDLAVDLDSKTTEVAGAPVHLTFKEYQMMELLALRQGIVITKEMFLNHLYGGLDEPELKIIDVFICKLRARLRLASGGRNFIQTVWGRGYTLRKPEACPPPANRKPRAVAPLDIARAPAA